MNHIHSGQNKTDYHWFHLVLKLPKGSGSGRWLRPHMMGRPMARLEAQHARIAAKPGMVLCRCWLYRMGEVTAKNLCI